MADLVGSDLWDLAGPHGDWHATLTRDVTAGTLALDVAVEDDYYSGASVITEDDARELVRVLSAWLEGDRG